MKLDFFFCFTSVINNNKIIITADKPYSYKYKVGDEKMGLRLWALEYIVEVAKTGSISKAAQNLYLSQPHLSNTVKSVENEMGVQIFKRSAKGMEITEDGKAFVKVASDILKQVESLEEMYYSTPGECMKLSISMTRSYQISRCISKFINNHVDKEQLSVRIKETNPFAVLEDVQKQQADFGVIHCFDAQKEYFLNCFKEYSLKYNKEYEREFIIAMSKENPLAYKEKIYKRDLENQTVVLYGDYETKNSSYQVISQVSDIVMSKKRIYVYERASAMETLENCPSAFMWITGFHKETVEQYNLVLRKCEDADVKNIGFSIFNPDITLSDEAKELLTMLRGIDWNEELAECSKEH